MYEATGNIKVIFDTQTFPSGFSKREFVVTVGDDKYPQDIKFELIKDKCSWLDNFQQGQQVNVNFDIRGNEYNGKYYVNLNCWKIVGAGSNQASAAPQANANANPANANASQASGEPSPDDLRSDDIPF